MQREMVEVEEDALAASYDALPAMSDTGTFWYPGMGDDDDEASETHTELIQTIPASTSMAVRAMVQEHISRARPVSEEFPRHPPVDDAVRPMLEYVPREEVIHLDKHDGEQEAIRQQSQSQSPPHQLSRNTSIHEQLMGRLSRAASKQSLKEGSADGRTAKGGEGNHMELVREENQLNILLEKKVSSLSLPSDAITDNADVARRGSAVSEDLEGAEPEAARHHAVNAIVLGHLKKEADGVPKITNGHCSVCTLRPPCKHFAAAEPMPTSDTEIHNLLLASLGPHPATEVVEEPLVPQDDDEAPPRLVNGRCSVCTLMPPCNHLNRFQYNAAVSSQAAPISPTSPKEIHDLVVSHLVPRLDDDEKQEGAEGAENEPEDNADVARRGSAVSEDLDGAEPEAAQHNAVNAIVLGHLKKEVDGVPRVGQPLSPSSTEMHHLVLGSLEAMQLSTGDLDTLSDRVALVMEQELPEYTHKASGSLAESLGAQYMGTKDTFQVEEEVEHDVEMTLVPSKITDDGTAEDVKAGNEVAGTITAATEEETVKGAAEESADAPKEDAAADAVAEEAAAGEAAAVADAEEVLDATTIIETGAADDTEAIEEEPICLAEQVAPEAATADNEIPDTDDEIPDTDDEIPDTDDEVEVVSPETAPTVGTTAVVEAEAAAEVAFAAAAEADEAPAIVIEAAAVALEAAAAAMEVADAATAKRASIVEETAAAEPVEAGIVEEAAQGDGATAMPQGTVVGREADTGTEGPAVLFDPTRGNYLIRLLKASEGKYLIRLVAAEGEWTADPAPQTACISVESAIEATKAQAVSEVQAAKLAALSGLRVKIVDAVVEEAAAVKVASLRAEQHGLQHEAEAKLASLRAAAAAEQQAMQQAATAEQQAFQAHEAEIAAVVAASAHEVPTAEAEAYQALPAYQQQDPKPSRSNKKSVTWAPMTVPEPMTATVELPLSKVKIQLPEVIKPRPSHFRRVCSRLPSAPGTVPCARLASTPQTPLLKLDTPPLPDTSKPQRATKSEAQLEQLQAEIASQQALMVKLVLGSRAKQALKAEESARAADKATLRAMEQATQLATEVQLAPIPLPTISKRAEEAAEVAGLLAAEQLAAIKAEIHAKVNHRATQASQDETPAARIVDPKAEAVLIAAEQRSKLVSNQSVAIAAAAKAMSTEDHSSRVAMEISAAAQRSSSVAMDELPALKAATQEAKELQADIRKMLKREGAGKREGAALLLRRMARSEIEASGSSPQLNTSPGGKEVGDERSSKLSKLLDLGFQDEILCKRMLVLHDGNIKDCIREMMALEAPKLAPLLQSPKSPPTAAMVPVLGPHGLSPLQDNSRWSSSMPPGGFPALQLANKQSILLSSTAPVATELHAEHQQLMLRQQQLLTKLGSLSDVASHGSPSPTLSPVQTNNEPTIPAIDTSVPNPHDFQHECRPVPAMPEANSPDPQQKIRERRKRQRRDRVLAHTVAILDALCNADSLNFKVPETVILNPADTSAPVRWYRMKSHAQSSIGDHGTLSRIQITTSTDVPKQKNHWVSEMSHEPEEIAKLIAARLCRDKSPSEVLAEFVKSSSSERKLPHTEYLNKSGIDKFIHRRWKGAGGVLREYIAADEKIGLLHVVWKSNEQLEVVQCHDGMHIPTIDTPKVLSEKLRGRISLICEEVEWLQKSCAVLRGRAGRCRAA